MTLYQRTKNSNEANSIPKYWDAFNGTSWKEGDKYKFNICGSSINSESKMLGNKYWRKYHSEAPEDQGLPITKE